MSFITTYLALLASDPITTITVSLLIVALLVHIVAPLVCGMWCSIWNYWDRGDSEKTNGYLRKIQKILGRSWVVQDSRGAYFDFSDSGWFLTRYSGSYVTHVKAKEKASQDPSWEAVEVGYNITPLTPHWLELLGDLAIVAFLSSSLAVLLDYLLLHHFTLLLVILAILAGLYVILKGGRALFDIRKKVDKLEAGKSE